MTDNIYESKIKELIDGNLAELVIEQPEFMEFREVWRLHPRRKEIIGAAGLNGRITYKFIEAPLITEK